MTEWVRNHIATTTLVSIISFWYGIQVVSVALFDLGPSDVYYWFYATTTPSPAWVFAPFSHQSPLGEMHVILNIGLLLVFGSYIESHLGTFEFGVSAVILGYITLFLQFPYADVVYDQPVSNAGFSGAALGLMAFASIHILRQHEPQVTATHDMGNTEFIWTRIKWTTVTTIMLVILIYTTLQLFRVVPSGNTSVATHMSGIFIGFLYEYIRPGIRNYSCS